MISLVISRYFRIWFWFLLILAFIGLVFYIAVIIPHNKLAAHHIENLKIIEVGMTPNQVRKIMGERGLNKNTWSQDSVYSYEAGLLNSSSIEIIFSENMLVRNVIVPDGIVSPIIVDTFDLKNNKQISK
jgi:hypothetical protein